MEEIKSLIDFYLTTQVVINFEDALDKLVGLTTEDNYLEITNSVSYTHLTLPTIYSV